MRLFVQPQLTYAASALLVSFLGAVAISATVYVNAAVSPASAVIWPFMVATANGLTMAFNAWAARARIADEALPTLVLVKSACNILQGLAWGCSAPMLHVPGEAVTVIAPAWAMVTGVGVLVFSSAPWPPSTYTFITALFLPAVAYLLFGAVDPLASTVGMTMTVCFPFCLVIGRLGARYVGDLVHARLAVNALLERESLLSARLRHLNEERTRFFSAASHDLRQPLQALNLYTSLIGRTPSRREQQDLLARLSDCADMLDRQFNAILGVAGADALTEHAEPRAVALQPLIDRAIAGHQAQAQAKGLRLRSVRTRAAALAAPEVIERIISNLVGNAVRYTHAGGVTVGVRRRGRAIAVMVADTGIGISPEDQSRIFDEFFQVANPERNSSKGFGLGLAIVKRLAEGSGWPVRLSSRLGSGSAFSVELPRAAILDVAHNPATAIRDAAQQASPLPVVLLDDDALVRDAMSRLLSSWDVEHRACATPRELFAVLEEAPQRNWAIILDYRLENGVTGVDVLDDIRRRHGHRHVFLMLSGELDPAVEEASHARQALLLHKPLKPIRLRAALSALAQPDDG